MARTSSEIIELLARGDLGALIGEFESDSLECKAEPYRLKELRERIEFAKDVSAIANASGGVLLIGFATGKDAAHGRDKIVHAQGFEKDRFEIGHYKNILRDWIYPRLDGIPIHFFPTTDNYGVAAIEIPQLRESDRPAVVLKSFDDGGKEIGFLFGLFQRKQDSVTHYDGAKIQSLLRDGHRLDDEIREGFQAQLIALQDGMQELREELQRQKRSGLDEGIMLVGGNPKAPQFERSPSTEPASTVEPFVRDDFVESIHRRQDLAVVAAGLQALPALILRASPDSAIDIRGLFSSRSSPEVKLLEKPPQLRPAGFNLDFDSGSRIIEGKARRVLSEGHGIIDAYRDGLVVLATRGDGERLCWPPNKPGLFVNQIALIETTYLFTRFVEELYTGKVTGNVLVHVHLELNRMEQDGKLSLLAPGPMATWRLRGASASSPFISADTAMPLGEGFAGRATGALVSTIYHHYGFEDDNIPYATQTPDGPVIDPAAIRDIKMS